MTTQNFSFDAITDGLELSVGQAEFVKLTSSATNTITVTSGKLNYVGTNGTPTTYAFETGNVEHSFKVTYGGTGLSGSFLTCCARIVDYRNMLGLRFSASTTLELVSLTNATPTVIEAWTVTRGSADEIEIIIGASDHVQVKFNGVARTFVGTGFDYKVITTFAGATKVGFCNRSGPAANGVITAASVTYAPPTSVVNINGGTNSVQIGSSGNTVTTTGMATATSATIGSVSMTSLAGSADAYTFSVPSLTDAAVSPYPSGTFTINGPAGSPTLASVGVTLPTALTTSPALSGTINSTPTGVVYGFSPAAVLTDRIFYPPVPAVGKYIAVDAQANIDTNHSGTVEFWHWQASTGISRSYNVIVGAGTTPDQFTFTDVTGVALGSTNTSNAITVTGVTAGVDIPISVTGTGQYQVSTNGGASFGAPTSVSGYVQAAHQARVVLQASGSYGAPTSETLTIGGVSDTYTVTTLAAPNLAPVVSSVTLKTATYQIAATDPNGDSMSYAVTTQGQYGTASVNGSGLASYTSGVNFKKKDKFIVTVSDGNGGSTAVTIKVGAYGAGGNDSQGKLYGVKL